MHRDTVLHNAYFFLNYLTSKLFFTFSSVDVQWLVSRTEGYSGADLSLLCKDAVLMPMRDVSHLAAVIEIDSVRKVVKQDFVRALTMVRPSVDMKELTAMVEWNRTFGSFQYEEGSSPDDQLRMLQGGEEEGGPHASEAGIEDMRA
jgi:hypothetical protein